MADMKIIIGAEIKELEQKLQQAKNKLSELGGTAKSTETAIGGLGSKLASVAKNLVSGGIAAGIAVITGAVIMLVKSFFEASEASKKLKEENEKITKTFLEAADAAGEEMGKVSLLTAVLESENATRLQKATALKELKKINYDYFGQLDIEDGKVKGLTTAYDGYIQRIIRSINAKASVDLLTDAYKEQAKALAQINQNIKAGEEKFTTSNLTEFQVQDAIRRFGLTFGAKKGESVIIDLNEKQLIADLLNAEAKIRSITSVIKENIIDAFNPKAPKEVKVKVEKITVESLPDPWKGFFLGPDVPKMTIKPDLTIVPNIKKVVITPEAEKAVFDGLQKMFDAEKLENFQMAATEAINAAISNIVTDSIGSMAEAVGNAIAGGKDALPNLFDNLIRGIGNQIKELGKYLVKIGAQMLIAKQAVEKIGLSPQAAIIAGVGLQVLAGALQAAFNKKLQGFASGTTGVSQGGFYDVGERGRERVFLPQGSKVQPANEVQAYGGGGVMLQPSIHYEGTGFRIMLNRVDAQMSRNG